MAEDDERAPRRWELGTISLGPAPTAAASPVRGRFDEIAELGRGGMGRVVEAVDRTLGRTVAIKHSLAADAVSLARFQREVLITARLSHPSIMPILDVGHDDDGQPYYIMRRIHGEPLDRRVAAITSVRDRLALIPAILAAVDATAYAHAQGIVHRDIKPPNILLGPFGEVLLIDWGLARELGNSNGNGDGNASEAVPPDADGLTRAGRAFGTPGFMAPEQARGEPADRRADVYGLGATLHFTLTGRSPFHGVAATEMVALAAGNTAPAALPDDVPTALAAITRKALAADPAARYPDAGELAADLRRFLAGQLVAAHPYTTRDRIVHGLRRHRLVAAVAGVALIILAIGGVLSIAKILAERDHADDARRLAEDRADELVVDRARAFVQSDPTSALAALRELPASSPRWPIAREIVRAAVAGGYDRLVDQAVVIRAVAYSPAGRLAMATGTATGDVRIYDDGPPRTIAERDVTALAWLDDRTLAAITQGASAPGQLVLVDTVSGSRRPLAIGFSRYATARGRIYLLAGDRVLEVDAAGASREVAARIAALDACSDRVALLGHDHLIVLDRDGVPHERAVHLPGRILQVRISASGERVAAFIYPGVVAWDFAAGHEAAWPSWPGSYESLNGIVFGGEALYGWSTVNNALVSFEAAGVVPQRRFVPSPTEGVRLARDGAALVLANPAGELVLGDALGLVPITHRPIAIAALALDRAHHRAAIGTHDGDLLVVELGAAIPTTIAVDPEDELQSTDGGRAVVLRDDSLAIVDGSGRRELGAPGVMGFATLSGDRVVSAGGTPGHRTLIVHSAAGATLLRATDVESVAFADGLAGGTSVFYTTAAGEVIEVGVDPGQPARTLARFPPVEHDGHRTTSIFGFEAADHALAVTSAYADAWSTWVFDRRGVYRLPFDRRAVNYLQRTPDGAWWFIDNDQLWRLPLGAAPERVLPGQRVRRLFTLAGRLWALGDASAVELTATGQAARAIGAVGMIQSIRDGLVRTSPDAVLVVAAAAGVERRFRVAGQPRTARASSDGRTVAALVVVGGAHRVAIWTDPVPVLPALVPAYLAGLTGARLGRDSDAVTWAP